MTMPATPAENALAVGDDGVRMRVIARRGDLTQVPFVLVHGLASNARLWDGVAEELYALGHSSYAVDLRGHGESERPDDGYDFATVAGDVAAVVRDVAERRVVLVGQSWGGNVVLETAARYPEVVRAVACIDGGFIRLRDTYERWDEAREALRPPSFVGMSTADLRAGMRRRLDGWPDQGIEGQLANFEEMDDGTIRPRLSLERHLTILEHLWRHDPDPVAGSLDIPVWVVATNGPGRRSRVERFARSLRAGRVTWVEADHDVHAQHPHLVADLLAELASEVAR